ncbi:MAG: hypothetical protein ACT4P1_08795 [Sporichthyaceae bacterium]
MLSSRGKRSDESGSEHGSTRTDTRAGRPAGSFDDLPDWMLPERGKRAWYGLRRKPAPRIANPKGGYDRLRGYDAPEQDEEGEREGVDVPAAILFLGVIALVLSVVPLIKYLAAGFALVAVILAAREFSRVDPTAKVRLHGRAVRDLRLIRIGRLVAILAIIAVVASTLWGMKQSRDDRIKASESGTALVLSQDVDVRFGTFTTGVDAIGAPTRFWPVFLVNKSGETRSFEILVEALNDSGVQIASQLLQAPKMSAGEERVMNAFEFVGSDTTQALKSARPKVAKATSSD